MIGVDRTTIRAYQKAGMPYKPGENHGDENTYRSSIVLAWHAWTKQKVRHKLGGFGPVCNMAFARSYVDMATLGHIDHEEREYFVKMLDGYVDERTARNAVDWAIPFVEGFFYRDKHAA